MNKFELLSNFAPKTRFETQAALRSRGSTNQFEWVNKLSQFWRLNAQLADFFFSE